MPLQLVVEDYFSAQPTATEALPDPAPLLENLARCVIEILAGARELEQISRWVSDEVYRHLLKRVVISSRARQARGQRASRPAFAVGSMQACVPRSGIVEAAIVVHGRARTRVVAIRLEGLDGRWRATALHVL
ncbi:Rv3235 family protein [Homoserinibacter sp. YIM 151385]|uniref:Rv3235 family protein n=1 Tax=Homoserinibacter sp. YIM 151385 TaxID=2985506 RepID=UPI0022F03192|nr:Rv3235 family protein [Homoserinibacter sp. YIM 151385]WBU37817.1 Rv3235 family protein [Homoserinibacter sp. YIM 151385]